MADNSSAASSALSPTWTRPKTPLPPDRLAKLANALGVSTPIPSSERPVLFARSFSETPNSPDAFRRSPTPSMASAIAAGFSPSSNVPAPTSKFLLHVIPPLHLPHDFGDSDDITAPPPTASGYHTQFRRGTLVPVHSSLQAQLAAIAKEYALPSTAGLILYLVSSGSSSSGPQSPSVSSHSHSKSPSPWGMEDMDEPGPRLSEDIWRHLWIRVLQAEQRDLNTGFLLPSISRSPSPLMLSPTAARSTPFLPNTSSPLNASNLRPPTPGSTIATPAPSVPRAGQPSITNSPSTPSSVSDTHYKSGPQSRSGGDSINGDAQEPGTPDTSVDVHSSNDDALSLNLPLPGLNSNALIPILAKVEFDIDPRKAGWYQPWVRSRKVNKAKRDGAKKGSKEGSEGEQEQEGEGDGDKTKREVKDKKHKKAKKPAIPLLTGNNEKVDWDAMIPPAPIQVVDDEPVEASEAELNGEGYTQLSDSDSEFDEDEFAEDSTTKVSSISHSDKEDTDPLQDVFGRDEDTWKDLKSERRATHEIPVNSNPNIVNLAITAQELSTLDGDASLITDDSHFTTPEEEEVRELLDRMSQGGRTPDPHIGDHLSDDEDEGDGDGGEDATVTSVTSPLVTSPMSSAQNTSGPSGKRHIPSPLILVPKMSSLAMVSTEPSPMPSTAGLPYFDDSRSNSQDSFGDGDDDDDDDRTYDYRAKSPAESEKRSGALFEDLDLGLDPSEDYDDDDPNDRRRSQYVMRAQLDEIERTLAQLSPRTGKNDLDEDGTMNQSFSSLSPNMSFGSPTKFSMSPLGTGNADLSPFTSPNRDAASPSGHLGFATGSPPRTKDGGPPTEPSTPAAGASWPAIPFSQIKNSSFEPEVPSNANRMTDPHQPPAPPQLALNGVTTSAPRSFAPRQSGEASAETLLRKKELEQEQALYRKDPSGVNVNMTRPSTPPKGSTDSPVIPLSPDPFGRFSSSTAEPPIIKTDGPTPWDDATTIGRSSMSGTTVVGGRSRSGTTSRFSVDSIPEEQAPAPKSNRGTLMSVKSIKNLWRKSNNKTDKKDKEVVPPTPTLPTGPSGSGRASPSSLVTLGGLLPGVKRSSGRMSPAGAPQRPDRPSGENFDLPDVPAMHASSTFGRVSPQPPTAPSSRPSSRASHESSRSRPSVDLPPRVPQRPSVDYANARRPSMDAIVAAQQRRSESSQDSMPPMPPSHNPNGQNLAVPHRTQPPSSRGPSPSGSSPIVPTQMLPSRGPTAMDRLHFDQESPYPNPLRRNTARTPSPPQQMQPHHQQHPSQSGLTSITEGQVERGQHPHKSILKRNTSSQQEKEDRMSGMNGTNGLRSKNGRQGSVASHSSGETASSGSPDGEGGIGRRPSLAPSFVSQASSIDSSQFEFVSPKMNSGMAYPASGYYGSGQQDS